MSKCWALGSSEALWTMDSACFPETHGQLLNSLLCPPSHHQSPPPTCIPPSPKPHSTRHSLGLSSFQAAQLGYFLQHLSSQHCHTRGVQVTSCCPVFVLPLLILQATWEKRIEAALTRVLCHLAKRGEMQYLPFEYWGLTASSFLEHHSRYLDQQSPIQQPVTHSCYLN